MAIYALLAYLLLIVHFIYSTSRAHVPKVVLMNELSKIHTDIANITHLEPLKSDPPIMFWRLQKVGSSSLVGLMMSYAFRYNILPKHPHGKVCAKLASCSTVHRTDNMSRYELLNAVLHRYPGSRQIFDSVESYPYAISTSHEICAFPPSMIKNNLNCVFLNNHTKVAHNSTKEIFLLRHPLSRAVSVYYFWGEIFKLSNLTRTIQMKKFENFNKNIRIADPQSAYVNNQNSSRLEFGVRINRTVQGRFTYHGNEFTPPPLHIVEDYARHFPYRLGMPGEDIISCKISRKFYFCRSFILFQCHS